MHMYLAVCHCQSCCSVTVHSLFALDMPREGTSHALTSFPQTQTAACSGIQNLYYKSMRVRYLHKDMETNAVLFL